MLNKIQSILKSKRVRPYLFIVFLALVTELFLFNFRHWESIFNHRLSGVTISYSEALSGAEKGAVMVADGEKYIEFTKINDRLKTSYIQIIYPNAGEDEIKVTTLHQAARDEGHEEYYGLPDRQLWSNQPRSYYTTYHLYGDCKSLKISLDIETGEKVRILCSLNPVIPMFFSCVRLLCIFFFLLFLYLFRPSSAIYRITFLDMKRNKNIALVSFVLGNYMLLYIIASLNPYFQYEIGDNQQEYQTLAETLSKGRVALEQEPSQILKDMENPYDYAHRDIVLRDSGEWFLWDYAYYNGKYYVYFGVVPAVIYYLPYYLLNGNGLHNKQVIWLNALFILIAFTGCFLRVIRYWFRKISLGAWILLSELFVVSSGLIYMCKRPDMYTVPIITGLAFAILGVWCILCARTEEGYRLKGTALGSLLIALVVGCRPQQFLIVLIPAYLVLHDMISKQIYSDKKKLCRLISALALPMILVAIPLMWYNYARFGSIFDFGANYNLSFNDMRKRGFVPDRLPIGIWMYLFVPIRFGVDYPFVEQIPLQTNYMGVTIAEATYGGLFAITPFLLILPCLFLLRRRISNKMLCRMTAISALSGFVLILVDTEMSGIMTRYYSDFSIFFLLAAILSWLALYQSTDSRDARKLLLIFLAGTFLFSVIYQGLVLVVDTGEALRDLRKDLFGYLKYQVMFWS